MFLTSNEYIKMSSTKECYRALLLAIINDSCNVAERAFDLLSGKNRIVTGEIIDKIVELKNFGYSFYKIDETLDLGLGSSRYYYHKYQNAYQSA